MTTETKLRAGLAASLLTLIVVTFEYFEKDRVYNEVSIQLKHTRDSLSVETALCDSLHDENFNKSVELGRHELTREEMFTKFKGLEKEYNNYLEHQTE
jgi:hypothetical protein